MVQRNALYVQDAREAEENIVSYSERKRVYYTLHGNVKCKIGA